MEEKILNLRFRNSSWKQITLNRRKKKKAKSKKKKNPKEKDYEIDIGFFVDKNIDFDLIEFFSQKIDDIMNNYNKITQPIADLARIY
jgi:hypothetical protein